MGVGGWIEGWMEGGMEGWTNRWMDGWRGEWINKCWVYKRVNVCGGIEDSSEGRIAEKRRPFSL